MSVSDYSTIPANNNATPPNGAPEGMQAGQTNNVIRQVMADVRGFYDEYRLSAYKTVSTQRISTTTLAADPHLTVDLTAGTYALSGFLAIGNVALSDTNGFKFDFSYSGTVTQSYINRSGVAVGTEITPNQALAYNIPNSIAEVDPFSVLAADFLSLTGFIIVSTSGTLALRWAQASSTATAVAIDAGSWLRLRKLS